MQFNSFNSFLASLPNQIVPLAKKISEGCQTFADKFPKLNILSCYVLERDKQKEESILFYLLSIYTTAQSEDFQRSISGAQEVNGWEGQKKIWRKLNPYFIWFFYFSST